MSRVETLRPEFVEFIPTTLEAGVLYISRKYKTASHLCCCGCGNKVVTPLKPGGWQLTTQGNTVTLHPSIGSWSLPCQSHYVVRAGKIVWASKFSKSEIAANRLSDQQAREAHFDAPSPREGFGRGVFRWLAKIFGG
jgi:hypothetical protein